MTVKAFPGEVSIELDLGVQSECLTVKQAKTLAGLLRSAAKEAKMLDWEETANGDLVVVSR